jgi:hypothetical protein
VTTRLHERKPKRRKREINADVSYIGTLTPAEEFFLKMRDAGHSLGEIAREFGIRPLRRVDIIESDIRARLVGVTPAKRRRLMELYRLTPEDHAAILRHQGGVCAVTKKPMRMYGTDHCHATGLIRGILDWRINKGLAFFNDDPKLLRSAADYLDNPPATIALGAPRYGLIGRAKTGKRKKVYGPPPAAR